MLTLSGMCILEYTDETLVNLKLRKTVFSRTAACITFFSSASVNMRIFWHSGKKDDDLSLLYETISTPNRSLNFPAEIVKKILDHLPRSSLPAAVRVNHLWYTIAMPVLYRHLYIRTLTHWMLLQRTFEEKDFAEQFGPYVSSLVLKPSPRLVSSQLTSALNVKAIENDDQLQPSTRGYVRLERVNYDLTGLEHIETPWTAENEKKENENNREIDTSSKEAEWLSFIKDEQICNVLNFCYNLEYLDLSGCENLTDKALFPIFYQKSTHKSKRPSRLKGLWLNLLRNLTIESLANIVYTDRDLGGLSQLKHLDLEFVVSLRDMDIDLLLSNIGSSLTHLKLNSAYELTNASVASISNYCPNLKLLYLTRCWRIDNRGIEMLSKHCKNLQYVSASFLSNVNENGLVHLVRSSRELVWLDITGCGINAFFKNMVLESWKIHRIEHHLPYLFIHDEKLNLI